MARTTSNPTSKRCIPATAQAREEHASQEITPLASPKGLINLSLGALAKDGTQLKADEEVLLGIAVQILERRLQRLGTLTDPRMAADYLKTRLGPLEREAFLVMLLDTRHRILANEILFVGTIDGAEIHPREVVKLALIHTAAAVICAHNHPSGDPEPSAADRAVTARLKSALALVDIRLLDHIVVGPLKHVSMAERGWV